MLPSELQVRHWIFNVTEGIWAQVKDYIAVNNDTYKLAHVEKLEPYAFASVSIKRWRDAVKSAHKKEEFYLETDGHRNLEVEPVVKRVNVHSEDYHSNVDNSSDTDSETDTE